MTIGQAIGGLAPLAPRAASRPPHSPKDLIGYFEVHIEQGPVLESRSTPVGVVSAIAGQTRSKILFTGKAGHAGTTSHGLAPRMRSRGAAEFALAAETLARANPPLVATVGTVVVSPGASNVIPARADLSLDLRHPQDSARLAALKHLQKAAAAIARKRNLKIAWSVTQDNGGSHVFGSPERGPRPGGERPKRAKCFAWRAAPAMTGVVMSEVCGVAMRLGRGAGKAW